MHARSKRQQHADETSGALYKCSQPTPDKFVRPFRLAIEREEPERPLPYRNARPIENISTSDDETLELLCGRDDSQGDSWYEYHGDVPWARSNAGRL